MATPKAKTTRRRQPKIEEPVVVEEVVEEVETEESEEGMSQDLKDALNDAGLSDADIVKLEKADLFTEDLLADTSQQELTRDVGLSLGKAKIVKTLFPLDQEAVAVVKPAGGNGGTQTIVVNTGKLEDKTLKELLEILAHGERTAEVRAIVRTRTEGHRCFVREEGTEKIDVLGTMDCLEYIQETGEQPEMWGNAVVETLDEVLDRQRRADPLSGEALQNGKAQDGVDWNLVTEQHQVYAAFAAQEKLLTGNEDRFTLVKELAEKNLTGRWVPILARYRREERAHPEKIASARAALIFRRKGGAQPAEAGTFPGIRRT